MSNWPAGLPFTGTTVADSAVTTRNAAYFFTAFIKTISDALLALLGVAGNAWTAPTLTGSWVNFGAPFYAAGYVVHGIEVRLSGVVKSGGTGTGNPIFTLPVGLRPSQGPIPFVGASGASGGVIGVANLAVDTSGRVYVVSYETNAGNAYVSLDDISFTAD